MGNDFTIPLKLETADALRSIQAVKASLEQMTRVVQQDVQQRLAQSASAGASAGGGAAAAAGLAAAGGAGGAGPAGTAAATGGGGPGAMARARALMAQAAPITNMFNQAEGGFSQSRTVALQEMALNAELIPGVQNKAIIGAVAPEALGQLKADSSAMDQVKNISRQIAASGGRMSSQEKRDLFQRFHAREVRMSEDDQHTFKSLESETMLGRSMEKLMEAIGIIDKRADYQHHEH